MGRRTRRELLQWNNSYQGSELLGKRIKEEHNASGEASVWNIENSNHCDQHHSVIGIPKRCTHLHLQETMESIDTRATCQSKKLFWLCSLVSPWPSRHMEWASLYKAFLSLSQESIGCSTVSYSWVCFQVNCNLNGKKKRSFQLIPCALFFNFNGFEWKGIFVYILRMKSRKHVQYQVLEILKL